MKQPNLRESAAPVSASTGTGNGPSRPFIPSDQVANGPPLFLSFLQLQADAASDANASALADCLDSLNFLYASSEFQLIEEELR